MMSNKGPLLSILKIREYNPRIISIEQSLLQVVNKKIDSEFNGMMKHMASLRIAMKKNVWEDIDTAFADIMMNILDSDPEQMYTVTDKKAQQREFFVVSGGLQLLLQLFSPPFVKKDARSMTNTSVEQKSEFFNGLLVTLREVAFVVPSLAEKIFNDDHIVFLFTMLSHPSVFDNTMNLLEEIIATKLEMFNLSLVPNLFDLINGFNSRTLSHFCRLFSMLLFEPEDRQIIEGTQVLRSIELLRLRRNRMTKTSVNIVERNQTLVINMPGLLDRLVQILRVVNHGPSLHEFIAHNIAATGTLTSQTLSFHSSGRGTSDWTHFANLEKIASNPIPARTASGNNGSGQGTEEDDMADLLHAFSAGTSEVGILSGNYQQVDVRTLVNVMQLAQELDIASATTLGQAIVMSTPHPHNTNPPPASAGIRNSLFSRSRALMRAGIRPTVNRSDPVRAKKELQFHAMLLSTHQIEIIFVLCTLLSGRRKVHVQSRLSAAGLGDVLMGLYDRMSWEVPSSAINSPSSVLHVHGPNCECNTESAIRVQLLRLIHNFHDRDFLGNSNKLHALTTEEVEALMDGEPHERDEDDMIVPQQTEAGLLTKIASTLLSESPDSVYRFWLSACLENFLRGSGNKAQCFVANMNPQAKTEDKTTSGTLLIRTLQHVVSSGEVRGKASLQTAFDLLGELLKGNSCVGLALDRGLSDEEFQKFWRLVVDNLVDSNVFLRSAYLLLELVRHGSAVEGEEQLSHHGQTMNRFGFYVNSLRSDDEVFLDRVNGPDCSTSGSTARHGYLTHSYVQFSPAPLSSRAMDLFSEPNRAGQRNVKKSVNDDDTNPNKSAFRNSLVTLSEVLGAVRRATNNILSFVEGGSSDSSDEPDDLSDCSSDDALADLPSLIRLGDSSEAMATFGLTGSSLLDVEDGRGGSDGSRDFGAELRDVLDGAKKNSNNTKKKETKCSLKHITTIAGHRHLKDYQPEVDSRKVMDRNQSLLNCKLFAAVQVDKNKILLRLMSVVNQSSVNHENICCINTALLILLFDHKRGELARVLNELRVLAEEAHDDLNRRDSFDQDSDGLDSLRLERTAVSRDGLNGPGAIIVMRNFRELLWYWREYYLRRGRDRLSIEFSSHISFSEWEALVGLLCADDGSSTALLSRPMSLGVSAFRRPALGAQRPQDGEVLNC